MSAYPPALRTQGNSLLVYEGEAGALRATLRCRSASIRRVHFALDIANGTDAALLVTVYAITYGNDEVPVAPFSFWIDARTDGYVDLPCSWLATLTTRALSVHVQGRNVHQRLETAMPRASALGWFLSGALAVALAVAFVSWTYPRVVALDAPPSVIAGTPMTFHFATRGLAWRRWEIDDLRGGRVSSGALAAAGGTATVVAPRTGRQRAYALRIVAKNAFARADASRAFVVVTPRPSAPPPRVIAFSVDRATVPDGGTIVARYRVSADTGTVLAVDALGNIVAQAAIHGSGSVALQLPHLGAPRELEIRLVVRRGAQLATAGIGIDTVVR